MRLGIFASTLTMLISAFTAAPLMSQHADVLNLPLSDRPITFENIPFTKALQALGLEVSHGYVLFGVEMHLEDDKEPTVSLRLPPDSTMRDGLEQIFAQVKNYEYKTVGESLIDIYPKGAAEDPADVLNLRVESFTIEGQSPSHVLSAPESFIPQLMDRLAPTGQPRGVAGSVMEELDEPKVTVRMRDATVREILNAVAAATEQFPAQHHPMGWFFSAQRKAAPDTSLYSWRPLLTAPPSWKTAAEQ